MKLIDKNVIVAELEKRMQKHHRGYLVCLNDILSFLDTLEVKEVDLEKEYKDFVKKDPVYNKSMNGIFGKAIAKHFFKLGLKVQAEEQIMKNSIDAEVGYWNTHGLSLNIKLPNNFEEGDKCKVIIIKQ